LLLLLLLPLAFVEDMRVDLLVLLNPLVDVVGPAPPLHLDLEPSQSLPATTMFPTQRVPVPFRRQKEAK
jgi:hypothetical protein